MQTDETTKYQKEWDDYKNQQADGCLIGIFLVVAFIITSVISRNYPDYEKFFIGIFVGLFFIVFVYHFYKYIFGKYWKCPRCTKVYYYPNRWDTDNKCRSCNLPKYYGSSYFYDQWGTEQGKDFAKRIEEKKL